jgi:ribosomal protein L35
MEFIRKFVIHSLFADDSNMKKSVSKRIRVTKNGKIIRRSTAIDHFHTRKNQKRLRNKRKTLSVDYPAKKILNY